MKVSELTDISIEEPNSQIVIELPNGQRLSTTNYYFDISESGGSIIVMKTGKKQKKLKY